MESDAELLARARTIAAERERYKADFAAVQRGETASLPRERVDVLFELVQRASKVKGELDKRGLDIPSGMDGRGLASSNRNGQQAITPAGHAPDKSWKTATIIPRSTPRVAPASPKPILGFRRNPSREATQAASYEKASLHHEANQDAFLTTLQLREDCVAALAAGTELSASIAGVRAKLRQAQRDFEETAFGHFGTPSSEPPHNSDISTRTTSSWSTSAIRMSSDCAEGRTLSTFSCHRRNGATSG